MASLKTGSDTGTWCPSSVLDVFAGMVFSIPENCLQSRLYKAPGPGVERLLLRPNDLLHVGVFIQLIADLRPGEGVQLLDADDGNVVDFVGLTMLTKSGIDLTRADQETCAL